MTLIDQAAAIREGEELDSRRLSAYLRDHLPGLNGPLSISQFPGGHSNLTYLIRVGDREMVLRRPPGGTKAKGAHDMGREYRLLTALRPVFPRVPQTLLYCDDPEVIGAPFYLMERLRGIIIRRELPPELGLNADQVRQLFARHVETQFQLHSLDLAAIGLQDFGRPQGYVERQVQGWSRRYRQATTPGAPDFEPVIAWLEANRPPDSDHPGIIHNDFKFDNLVLDPQNPLQIIGILDWEMATVGDPLMDLGSTLGYWVEAADPPEMQPMRTLPTHVPGAMSRREVVAYYAELAGRRLGDFSFYYCFGLFRLAVIAQQIYFRYHLGQTRDRRFRTLDEVVRVLHRAALRTMDRGMT
ncbi:MAG: phosphotransferase family protein [Deltaproteobacteria bacterium]|nr:phosphotransferase family protein [Deltaproteobacteria bacterium]